MSLVQLLENTDFYRIDANRKLDPKTRYVLGQFMTPAPIARFMASLFGDYGGSDIRLLDPGAGVGTLTAAFIEEFTRRPNSLRHINVTAYEIDPILREYITSTIRDCHTLCDQANIELRADIRSEDFIREGAELLAYELLRGARLNETYTHTIINPPYRKIKSTSDHRKYLRTIGIETSNLYTGFLTIAIKLLKPGGELVAIVPRSFCNGPYFKPFRELLLGEMAICHLHVFDSRACAFKDDEILQENIIFHAVKNAIPGQVTITSSNGNTFHINDTGQITTEDMTYRTVDYTSIVKPHDPEKFIHIAATELDQRIVDRISVFNHTLTKLGIEVSTGPVVDFRLKNDLSHTLTPHTVPLLYSTHFPNNHLEWPKTGKKPNAIIVSENSRKWLWPNKGYYVITRRFTAKEEKRRVVAAVYDSSLPGELIGFENHLNVFHINQNGMPKDIAEGLALYLNSTILDKYFRQFNGHTQVNATDLRSLHYPDRDTLKRLSKLLQQQPYSQHDIDAMLNKEMNMIAQKEANNMVEQSRSDPVRAKQKIEDALAILKSLGMPKGQHNERSALTLLALLGMKPEDSWQSPERPLIGITPIMDFSRDYYGTTYAPNTRETFRRQTMHQLVEAGIAVYNPDDPKRAVNSPKACYQVSQEAFDVIITFGTKQWKSKLSAFIKQSPTLAARYARERVMQMIPVNVAEDKEITLSPGPHSQLIKDIIVEFAPRYVPNSEVIYVGDTGDKIGYFQRERLSELGVDVDKHGKMPDVVLYCSEKDWLLLIESVTSHGPVNAKRHNELATLFKHAHPGLIFVTAFPDRAIMAKYLNEISWETEVWVAEAPTHLIHFNGERFLGPYKE